MIPTKSYNLQTETRRYLRRLYSNGRELAGADIDDLDNFIIGLKQINLWQNILCWPMRRQHNVGTGTKLLSLGGLGTYDGTLFNSPTWNNTGIIFNGTSHYIEFNNPSQLKSTTLAGLTMFAVIDSDRSAARCVIGSGGVSTSFTFGPTMFVGTSPFQGGSSPWASMFIDMTKNGGPFLVNFQYNGGNTGTMETICGGLNSINKNIFGEYNNASRINSATITDGYVWNDNATWNIGRRVPPANSYFFLGAIPFCLIANRPITRTEYESLRDLHKTTIGKGLGLP